MGFQLLLFLHGIWVALLGLACFLDGNALVAMRLIFIDYFFS